MPCDSHGISRKLARPERFELPTPRFVVCRLGPITSCEVVEALTREQSCQRELQGVTTARVLSGGLYSVEISGVLSFYLQGWARHSHVRLTATYLVLAISS